MNWIINYSEASMLRWKQYTIITDYKSTQLVHEIILCMINDVAIIVNKNK